MKYLTKALNDAIDNDEFGVLVKEISKFVWDAVSHDRDGVFTVGELTGYVQDVMFHLDPSYYIFRGYSDLEFSVEHQLDRII